MIYVGLVFSSAEPGTKPVRIQIEQLGALVVSGTITWFSIDWNDEGDRSFELAADYTVQSGARILFSWHCSSVQKGSNRLA